MLLSGAEGHIGEGATRKPSVSPTRWKTLGMRRSSPNRSREISPVPAVKLSYGGSGKALGRAPDIRQVTGRRRRSRAWMRRMCMFVRT